MGRRRTREQRTSRTAAAALAAALLCACSGPFRLGVDTVYVIEDLDAATRATLSSELRRYATSRGREVVEDDADGGRFVFRLPEVTDVATLREVQSTIQRVSERARVPVVLQEASLRFASVHGGGSARIQVDGTATPGAAVLLDVGHEVVTAEVTSDGRWSAAVRRTPGLRRRGGWIYALVIKGEARQYLEMNVLDTGASRAISRDELPPDSPLRDR